MPKKESTDELLKPKERVVATDDMPGIPAGTTGRVILPEGLTWIRYWVRFDNGQTKGSINRKKLARPDEWADLQERRARGEDVDAPAGADGAAAGTASGSDDGSASAVGDGPVPAYLLERSRARREVLGKPLT